MGIPEFFEAKPGIGGAMPLGEFGVVEIVGWNGECLMNGQLHLRANVPKLRIYDVWARVGSDWFQLNQDLESEQSWYNEDLAKRPIERFRLWVGAAWDMTLEPAPPRQPNKRKGELSYSPPVVCSEEIPPYVPVVELSLIHI